MSSQLYPKTVELYGSSNQHEAIASTAITPGMLVARTGVNADGVDTVGVHSVSGGVANPSFAVEYDLDGRGIDDDYAEGDNVVFRTYTNGSAVYAVLGEGEEVEAGDFLMSGGDGTLVAHTAGGFVVAQALEAPHPNGRVRAEILTGFVPGVGGGE